MLLYILCNLFKERAIKNSTTGVPKCKSMTILRSMREKSKEKMALENRIRFLWNQKSEGQMYSKVPTT